MPQTFTTRDLQIAALAVVKGKKLVRVEVTPNRRVYIHFEGTLQDLEDLQNQFRRNEPVGVRDILTAYLDLRSFVISAVRNRERGRTAVQKEEEDLFD